MKETMVLSQAVKKEASAVCFDSTIAAMFARERKRTHAASIGREMAEKCWYKQLLEVVQFEMEC